MFALNYIIVKEPGARICSRHKSIIKSYFLIFFVVFSQWSVYVKLLSYLLRRTTVFVFDIIVIGRSQAKFQHESFGTKTGGAEEDRTPDPLLAKQVLSQLSYSPENFLHLRSAKARSQVLEIFAPSIIIVYFWCEGLQLKISIFNQLGTSYFISLVVYSKMLAFLSTLSFLKLMLSSFGSSISFET